MPQYRGNYYMKVLKRRDVTMVVHAAKYPNVFHRPYGTWVEGKRSSTIPHEGFENTKLLLFGYKIKVEILNTQINRSRTQIYGVGENPLNRKGIPLPYYLGRVKK